MSLNDPPESVERDTSVNDRPYPVNGHPYPVVGTEPSTPLRRVTAEYGTMARLTKSIGTTFDPTAASERLEPTETGLEI